MSAPKTNRDVMGTPCSLIAHINRGESGLVFVYSMDQFPRICFSEFHNKGPALEEAKGVRTERVWMLDGQPMASLQAAVDGHRFRPPPLNAVEAYVLEQIPDEFTTLIKVEDQIDKARGRDRAGPAVRSDAGFHINKLIFRGLIEVEGRDIEPAEAEKAFGLGAISQPVIRRRKVDG